MNNSGLILYFIAEILLLRVLFGKNEDAVFPGGNTALAYLPAFTMGMIFARYNLLGRILNKKKKALRFLIELVCIIFGLFMYTNMRTTIFWEIKWCLYPTLIIVFLVEFICTIKYLNSVLIFLGKHSMNIYLLHTFFRNGKIGDITYSLKHFLVVVLFLLISSLCCSIVLEFIKVKIRYHEKVKKITDNLIKKCHSF